MLKCLKKLLSEDLFLKIKSLCVLYEHLAMAKWTGQNMSQYKYREYTIFF